MLRFGNTSMRYHVNGLRSIQIETLTRHSCCDNKMEHSSKKIKHVFFLNVSVVGVALTKSGCVSDIARDFKDVLVSRRRTLQHCNYPTVSRRLQDLLQSDERNAPAGWGLHIWRLKGIGYFVQNLGWNRKWRKVSALLSCSSYLSASWLRGQRP